jgi:hypothetical protein
MSSATATSRWRSKGFSGDWPRAGWTEALQTAAVKQFGLEVPVSRIVTSPAELEDVSLPAVVRPAFG